MGVKDSIQILITVISVLGASLTSFAVCYITLRFTRKQNKKSLEQQQQNHTEDFEITELRYQEELDIQKESERLEHLPYLLLIPENKVHRFEGDMELIEGKNFWSIPFILQNEGAGIAFDVRLKYIEQDTKPRRVSPISVAYTENLRGGYDILGARSPIDTDVLRVGNQTEFSLALLAIRPSGIEIAPTSDIRWEIAIKFSDIQGRRYSQPYSFYTSTCNNKIFRVNSYMPELLDEQCKSFSNK